MNEELVTKLRAFVAIDGGDIADVEAAANALEKQSAYITKLEEIIRKIDNECLPKRGIHIELLQAIKEAVTLITYEQ
jgi:hypothetical protein